MSLPDQRIQYNELMWGANGSSADTLNRLALIEHDNTGQHKGQVLASTYASAPGATDGLANAIAALSSGTKTVIVTDEQHIIVNTSCYNPIVVMEGGSIVISSGVTFKQGTYFSAGAYQVFSVGTGTLLFSEGAVKEILPEWFGMIATPSFEGSNAAAFLVAAQVAYLCSVPIRLSAGVYDMGSVTLTASVSIIGSGVGKSILQAGQGGTATVSGQLIYFNDSSANENLQLKDFTINMSYHSSVAGLVLKGINNSLVSDIEIISGSVGLQLSAATNSSFERITCHDQSTSGIVIDAATCGDLVFNDTLVETTLVGTSMTGGAINIVASGSTLTTPLYFNNTRLLSTLGSMDSGIKFYSASLHSARTYFNDLFINNPYATGIISDTVSDVYVNGFLFLCPTTTSAAVQIAGGGDFHFSNGKMVCGAGVKCYNISNFATGKGLFSLNNNLTGLTAYHLSTSIPKLTINDIVVSGTNFTNSAANFVASLTIDEMSPKRIHTLYNAASPDKTLAIHDTVNNKDVCLYNNNGDLFIAGDTNVTPKIAQFTPVTSSSGDTGMYLLLNNGSSSTIKKVSAAAAASGTQWYLVIDKS